MIAPRHEIAWLESNFFREKFHKTLRWIMISIVIMFALIIASIYLILTKPMPNFYANTTDGKILPMPHAKIG